MKYSVESDYHWQTLFIIVTVLHFGWLTVGPGRSRPGFSSPPPGLGSAVCPRHDRRRRARSLVVVASSRTTVCPCRRRLFFLSRRAAIRRPDPDSVHRWPRRRQLGFAASPTSAGQHVGAYAGLKLCPRRPETTWLYPEMSKSRDQRRLCLQNILRQSYDYLTTMPKLLSTYDGRLIYRTSYEERTAIFRYESPAKL